jgi:hypothetical protein
MIGNPRGYGKSALMMEMAYKRDEICKRNNIPSGPVLFTDFRGVQSASDAENRVLETIQPLFFTLFSFINKSNSNKRGSTSDAYLFLSPVVMTYMLFIFVNRRIIA